MSGNRNALLAAVLLCVALAPVSGQDADKVSAIRQKCAEAKDKEALLNRFRLEKYDLKKDGEGKETVVLKGKFLPAGVDAVAKEKEALNTAMEGVCKAALNKTDLSVDHSGVEFVALKDLPHVALQTAANADGRDMVLFEPPAFDKDGKLALTARVGADADKEWVLAATKKHLTGYAVDAAGVKVVEWKVGRSTLQKKFAATGGNSARVRVERVRYEWAPTADDTLARRMVVSGVVLDSPQKPEGFEPLCREMWPELPWAADPPLLVDHGGLFGAGSNLPDASLLKALRTAVAATPTLDGVRVDPTMTFDEKGALCLTGVVPNQEAKFAEALAAAVQKFAADAGKVPDRASGLTFASATAGGVSTAKMTAVPLDKLLADVRQKVSDDFDDVRIARQFFTADGKLTLSGMFAAAADEKGIRAAYQSAAAKYFPGSDTTAKDATVDLKPFAGGFTAYLRGIVQGDQKAWAGVLLERGYFTPKGEYALRGLADGKEQQAAMAKLVDAESKNPRWVGYFDATPAPVALDLMPIEPMLARLKRVCPGYEAFDHLEVTGVVQHPSDGLVLSVDSYTAAKSPATVKHATDTAAWLLKNHPDWKRRSQPGVKLTITPKAVQSEETRWAGQGLGAMHLSRGEGEKASPHITSAVRHLPDSSGTWYMSALANAIAGEDELAQRDLYRTIQLEGELVPGATNDPRAQRYKLVEKVNAPRRAWLEQLEPVLRQKMRDGFPQVTLVPKPLATAK